MDKRDYIKTLHICGQDIDLGLSDCGQCYYIEWEEKDEKKFMTLGAYNFHYLENIYYLFDLEYRTLAKKELWGEEFSDEEKELWQKYQNIFDEEDKFYGLYEGEE